MLLFDMIVCLCVKWIFFKISKQRIKHFLYQSNKSTIKNLNSRQTYIQMSRLGSSSHFAFSSAQRADNSSLNEDAATSERFDIHPMELVVQSIVGEPLEALSNQLQTLHESQVVLIARLKIIEEKLKKFESQLVVDVDVKATEERLHQVKTKLTEALNTLKKVELRVRNKYTVNS